MTNEKNHENALAKSTENSYTKKENSLNDFKQLVYSSQSKNYSDIQKEISAFSKNNSFNFYHGLFYSLFV
mgnify:CR=1 FL=1